MVLARRMSPEEQLVSRVGTPSLVLPLTGEKSVTEPSTSRFRGWHLSAQMEPEPPPRGPSADVVGGAVCLAAAGCTVNRPHFDLKLP